MVAKRLVSSSTRPNWAWTFSLTSIFFLSISSSLALKVERADLDISSSSLERLLLKLRLPVEFCTTSCCDWDWDWDWDCDCGGGCGWGVCSIVCIISPKRCLLIQHSERPIFFLGFLSFESFCFCFWCFEKWWVFFSLSLSVAQMLSLLCFLQGLILWMGLSVPLCVWLAFFFFGSMNFEPNK